MKVICFFKEPWLRSFIIAILALVLPYFINLKGRKPRACPRVSTLKVSDVLYY